MKNLSNENIIHVKKDELEYIQFRKLLEYKNIKHCFTLKPLDFGSNATYEEKREEIEKGLEMISIEFEFSIKNICRPKQTHTDKVERVNYGDEGIYISKFDNIDGFVTDKKNKVLMLSFADCTPLLFYDPIKKVIANTHSGWKGTLQTIGVRTVEKMQKEYGCKPEDIICCIGPHIRKCHFEVDKDVRDLFYNKFKDLEGIGNIIEFNQENNKYYIDTAKINKQTLLNIGLREDNIIDSNICTLCNKDICHSYRAEKDLSGRAVTIIYLK
jgi:YfiH family protein